MFELEKEDKFIDRAQVISKTVFDLFRNTLIVGTIGYFYEKTQNPVLLVIYAIAQLFLGAYVGSLFMAIRFSNTFFNQNRGGQIFRLISSAVVALIISSIVIYGTTTLVKEAVAVQKARPSEAVGQVVTPWPLIPLVLPYKVSR